MGRGFDLRRSLADIWGQLIYGNNDIFVFYGQQTTCLGGISAEASEMRSSDGQLMKTSGALSDTRPAAAWNLCFSDTLSAGAAFIQPDVGMSVVLLYT